MNALSPRRWWVLGALVLSIVVVGLDSTVLNVALPTLATALDAGTAELQWVVDAYVLVLAGSLLPLGVAADRLGRRRMLLAGLAVFTAASLGAAFAPSAGWLIAARAVMGLGAAVIMSVPLALIGVLFRPAERPRAIATVTVAMGLGLPLGPILGGWLLEHFWWGSAFLVNVPVGMAAMAAIAALLPESRDPAAQRPDLLGSALSTAGLVGVVLAVVEAPERGWTSAPVLVAATLGVALLAGFVRHERRAAEPMVDLTLFARPRFALGTLAATVAMFALLGLLFVLPQYLQAVRGHDPLGTGIRLLPLIGGLVLGAKAAERLTGRMPTGLLVGSGLGLMAVALAGASTVQADTGYGVLALWLALAGKGLGLTVAPAMDAVLAELPTGRAGSGTALSMALRQVGGALGVAVLGTVAHAGYTGRLDVTGLPAPAARAAEESVVAGTQLAERLGSAALASSVGEAFVHAMTLVMLTSAALAVATAALVVLRMPNSPAPADSAPAGGEPEEPGSHTGRESATIAG